jgi:hypothetical protein
MKCKSKQSSKDFGLERMISSTGMLKISLHLNKTHTHTHSSATNLHNNRGVNAIYIYVINSTVPVVRYYKLKLSGLLCFS